MSGITRAGIKCVIGAVLIHVTLGTFYTFGNMEPYIASYLHFKAAYNGTTVETVDWISSAMTFCHGALMLPAGLLAEKSWASHRLVCALGCLALSGGVLITHFSVQVHVSLVVVTYGILFGVGLAFSYGLALGLCLRFFPARKGLLSGIVLSGFGFGAVIFNLVQTSFINPDNLSANYTLNGAKYFDQEKLLNRVPNCFLLIGGIYLAVQIIGLSLLKEIRIPEATSPDDKTGEYSNQHCTTIQRSHVEEDYDQLISSSVEDIEVVSKTKNKRPNTSKLAVIKSLLIQRNFWILWVISVLSSMGTVTINANWKQFGGEHIKDDTFFSLIGSISSIFNGSFRILWGLLLDYFAFKRVASGFFACFAAVMATLPIFYLGIPSEHMLGREIFFGIWICLHFAILCAHPAIIPTITARIFDEKYFAINYGVLFTSECVSGLFGGIFVQLLFSKIGYFGLWELIAGLQILGIFILLFFKEKLPESESADQFCN